jgi:hypothetical protein
LLEFNQRELNESSYVDRTEIYLDFLHIRAINQKRILYLKRVFIKLFARYPYNSFEKYVAVIVKTATRAYVLVSSAT